jgi:ADP-heptose:LPS heptosyltransferase
MRILALVPGGIGDQLLFFPTLDDLKRSIPNAEIDVVVEPRAKGAYEVCKSVNQIIPFDFKDRNSMSDWANLLGVIRDRYYDAALSLGPRWSIGLLLWLTGTSVRIGYAGGPGQIYLTQSVPQKTQQYMAHMYHDLLQGLNIMTPCPAIEISLAKRHITWAETQQQQLGIKDSGYVLLHIGPSESAQAKGIDPRYPVEQWQTIIQDFRSKQPDLPLVVMHGPDDADFAAALTKATPEVKAVKTSSTGRLAAMIAGANLMLCADNAAMHLGVALQVYTLALFGPGDPKKLLPESDRYIGIQSPTGKLADIDPQTILGKVWGG